MAAGNSYPAEIIDANGNVTEGMTVQFTDDTDQPGTSDGPPFEPTTGNNLTILKDSTGAHPLIVGGDDAGGASLLAIDGSGFISASQGSGAVVSSTVGVTVGFSDTQLVGFFGAAPVAQPAAPVTLGDVIAALQALGLVAT